MERIYRLLTPFANKYTIVLSWILSVVNLYLFMKPLNAYAKSAGLNETPIVLDVMTYYTAEQGYKTLSVLGENGRNAYRIANYTDFILPVLLFLSLSLPNIALRKTSWYIIGPFIYMMSDFIENIAEKYVLEIYPSRNDVMMNLACYFGLLKITTFYGSLLMLLIDGLRWFLVSKNLSGNDQNKLK